MVKSISSSIKLQWCLGTAYTISGASAKEVTTSFPTTFTSVYNIQLSQKSNASSCCPMFSFTTSSVTYGLSRLASSSSSLMQAHIFATGY